MSDSMRMKRSLPEWLKASGPSSSVNTAGDETTRHTVAAHDGVKSSDPAVLPPSSSAYASVRQRQQVPEQTALKRESKRLLPGRSDVDSAIVRNYITHHQLTESEFNWTQTLVGILSRIARKPVEIVGCYADGTASRRDSNRLISAVVHLENSADRHALFESIRITGPANNWSVSPSKTCPGLAVVKPLDKRGFTVHLYTDSVDLLITRTNFVKLYTHLIDSSLAILTCILRSKIRPSTGEHIPPLELDYFVITLLWRTMVRSRLLPSLIQTDESELADETMSDILFWSPGNNPSIARWRLEGLNARPRASLASTVSEVMSSVDIDTINQMNICPIFRTPIIENDSILVMLVRDICDKSYSASAIH
jgi:hypothetical protein